MAVTVLDDSLLDAVSGGDAGNIIVRPDGSVKLVGSEYNGHAQDNSDNGGNSTDNFHINGGGTH